MIKLPGLIDPHVHIREPGATHKEDWDSGTAAALAGGFTMVLAMPNTQPPIFDASTLELALNAARQKAHCDYAQYLGAGPDNAEAVASLADKAAALKMYLDMTFGQLRLDDMTLWMPHFEKYPKQYPVVTHSESRSMAAAILFSEIYDRPAHIAHVSLEEEILLIKAAKEKGIQVTCEVCPHHLFLASNAADGERGKKKDGRLEVRPRKRLGQPSTRFSRPGDRIASAAYSRREWTFDLRRFDSKNVYQSEKDISSSRSARDVDRGR
jgi:carbamoyl-phosphate synthase/aspartate carbamoyltransferase/dihydroorotase